MTNVVKGDCGDSSNDCAVSTALWIMSSWCDVHTGEDFMQLLVLEYAFWQPFCVHRCLDLSGQSIYCERGTGSVLLCVNSVHECVCVWACTRAHVFVRDSKSFVINLQSCGQRFRWFAVNCFTVFLSCCRFCELNMWAMLNVVVASLCRDICSSLGPCGPQGM